MTTTDPAIDFERKFQDQVTANMRAKADFHAKLADAHVELQQARLRITALEAQVQEMTPAQERLEQARNQIRVIEGNWRQDVAAKDKIITEQRKIIGGGQRRVIEGVIGWLQQSIAKLPEPVREDIEGIPADSTYNRGAEEA